MHRFNRLSFAVALAGLLIVESAVAAPIASGDDWPQYRGPARAGVSTADVFPDGDFDLEIAWRVPLGSGYSEVSIVRGLAITLFAAADGHDVAAAFDVENGDERWRYVIAETYAGHTGSDDGPLSTPAISEGVVFGLGPRGDVFALDLETGARRWHRTLAEDEAEPPYYGFTASPLVVGEVVVVGTGGGDGRAITGFDRATGTVRWQRGDGGVGYASPALVDLGGRQHLVASTASTLYGIDPGSGALLWQHAHGLEGTLGTPAQVDSRGLMVRDNAAAVVIDVVKAGDSMTVAERWRSTMLKNSFALPVVHEGHVYGMSGQFLTAVDLADGSRVWRSRPPGGTGLVLADGHLVIGAADGALVIAEATAEGYRETARLALFEQTSFAAPSVARGQVFVRDLHSQVAVRARARSAETSTVTATAVAMPDAASPELLGPFGARLRTIAALPLDQRSAALDALLVDWQGGPITEVDGPQGFAHFLYRGDAEDVAISGNLEGMDGELLLTRLPGTDLSVRSFALDPTSLWQYQMNIDLSDPGADPGNPRRLTLRGQPYSLLAMPEARETPHLDLLSSETARGRMTSFAMTSEHLGDERTIDVYLPAGYDEASDARLPLLVHTFGGLRGPMGFESTLDFLIANESIPPVIVAFVPRAAGRDHGAAADAYIAMLGHELMPALEARYRITEDRRQRAISGLVSGAGIAVYAGLELPMRFGKVAVQSLVINHDGLGEIGAVDDLSVYLEARSHDVVIDGTSATDTVRAVAKRLEAAGADVTIAEIAGGTRPLGWGTDLDLLLVWLFAESIDR